MDDKALGNVAGNPKPVQQTLTNFVIAEEEASPMEKLQGDISRMLVMLQSLTIRAVPRTLIGGGCVYSYIHVLPDQFLFKLINLNLISKETSRAEHAYMNKHPPPLLTF